MNNTRPVRLPAEWEGDNAVMISWPHSRTDWNYMLDEVVGCYRRIVAAIVPFAPVVIVTPEPDVVDKELGDTDRSNIIIVEAPTNDTWIRDYGPITTLSAQGKPIINDFTFNGWGLKFASDLDNCVTRYLIKEGFFSNALYANRLGFVLEGGGIESDGLGTLLTTSHCLLSPNRNPALNWDEIEQCLMKYFGLDRVLRLDYGQLSGDDTDGHIDTLARFVSPDTIVYCSAGSEPTHPDYKSLSHMAMELQNLRMADGSCYNLIGLPLPDKIYDPDDGSLLPATYANFLMVNNAVIMPSYGQPDNDLTARMALKVALPAHEIVSVDCRALIRQHGSLHCATMQVPKSILPL